MSIDNEVLYQRTRAAYDDLATQYAEVWSDINLDNELITRFESGLSRNSRVLDVGSGPGQYARRLRSFGHYVVCVDNSPRMAELSRLGPSTWPSPVALMDMRRLGFAADSFDAIWACASTVHIMANEISSVLREFRRILASPGQLLINATISSLGIRSETADEMSGLSRFGRSFQHYEEDDDFSEILRASGFEIYDVLHRKIDSRVLASSAHPTNSWTNFFCVVA
jgi:SAM-dependent methyltransferase